MKSKLIALIHVVFALLFICALAEAELEDAIGIWTFDGSEIGTDSSGNENHGVDEGGVELVDGVFGKAIELNGTNQAIDVPDSDTLDVEDDQLTMMCWFWWGGSGDGWQTFVSKGPMSGTNENWAFFINTVDGYSHFIITPGGGRLNVDSPGGLVEAETWTFVAGTYDGTQVKIYFDGELVKEQAVSGDLTPNDNSLRIGHREASPHWWMGMLDEVAVFHRPLDEDEINAIMNSGLQKGMSVQPGNKLPTVWGGLKSN